MQNRLDHTHGFIFSGPSLAKLLRAKLVKEAMDVKKQKG
jgi:hypothetical protein